MCGGHIREDIGMSVALYAGSQRSSSTADGRVTRHSFSFGPHYDPANLGFGPLVCHNDDVLDPSSRSRAIPSTRTPSSRSSPGSSRGRSCTPTRRAPGTSSRPAARRCSRPGPASGTARWPTPGRGAAGSSRRGSRRPRPAPSRRTSWARRRRRGPGWSTWPAATACRSAPAAPACWSPGWPPASRSTLPDDPRQHVFAATGSVALAGEVLGAGDAVRISDEPGHVVRASEATELLVWSFA